MSGRIENCRVAAYLNNRMQWSAASKSRMVASMLYAAPTDAERYADE